MGGLRRCAYFRCKTTSRGNKVLFRFPIHDRNRLRVWLNNCGNFEISHLSLPQLNNKYLCSDHFEKKHLFIEESKKRKRLSFSAVPFDYQQESIAPVVSVSPTPTPSTSQPQAHEGSLEELKVLIPQRIYRKEPSGKEQIVGDVGSSLRQEDTQNDITRQPQVRMIIAGVYRYLHVEYNNLKSSLGDTCDLSPLANILKRTAEATGVSEETVTIILEKEKSSAKSRDTPKMRSKRAKFNYLSENYDVNSDEEGSSCESSRNVKKSDAESDEEEEQYELIETLKLEFEEDMDHSKYINERKRIEIESRPCQTTSTVHNWLPLTQTSVKPEPLDAEEEQTSSVAHRLLSSTRAEMQHEPSDVLHRQAGHVELQTAPDATFDPVKTEPWDNDTDT